MRPRAVLSIAITGSIATAMLFAQGKPVVPLPPPTGAILSGRFTLEDGSPPPDRVRIELTCNSLPRPQGWSDGKGGFSVQLGVNNPDEVADLSYAKAVEQPAATIEAAAVAPAPPIDAIPRDLAGCELRGSLDGYVSRVIPLSGHKNLDSPDLGTIVLHPMANVEGRTTSGTTAAAPSAARKAFEKGAEATKKRKLDDAEKELKKAVDLYPKYAIAWLGLGRLYETRKRFKEATDAYRHSIESDSRYLYPYERLYILAANREQWPEVQDLTSKVIRLDPYDFPRAYYFSALANLNLGDLDAAERSARESVKLDLAANPRSGYVLGVILARKQNFLEAKQLLQAYLKAVPNSIEKDLVNRQLADLERYIAPK